MHNRLHRQSRTRSLKFPRYRPGSFSVATKLPTMSKYIPLPESSSLCCCYSCSTHPSTPQTKHVSSPERCVTDVCEEVVIGQEKNSLLKEKTKMFAGEEWLTMPPTSLPKALGVSPFLSLLTSSLTSTSMPHLWAPQADSSLQAQQPLGVAWLKDQGLDLCCPIKWPWNECYWTLICANKEMNLQTLVNENLNWDHQCGSDYCIGQCGCRLHMGPEWNIYTVGGNLVDVKSFCPTTHNPSLSWMQSREWGHHSLH